MKTPSPEELEKLRQLVQASAGYADISTDLVRSVGAQELSKRSDLKAAVKATRNKLHQVGSAYQEAAIPYAQLNQELTGFPDSLSDAGTLAGLKQLMAYHTSAHERLPILERIFKETLAPLAPIHSVLDIACGLNPLAIPWMPLSEPYTYHAIDIYAQMVNFLNAYFTKYHINGHAAVADVLQNLPSQPLQLALILKTIPCLEQIDKQAGKYLLENIPAENMLVSFPAHSLSGRSKGMLQNYETHFKEITAGKPWKIQRFEFPGELVFLVQKTWLQ